MRSSFNSLVSTLWTPLATRGFRRKSWRYLLHRKPLQILIRNVLHSLDTLNEAKSAGLLPCASVSTSHSVLTIAHLAIRDANCLAISCGLLVSRCASVKRLQQDSTEAHDRIDQALTYRSFNERPRTGKGQTRQSARLQESAPVHQRGVCRQRLKGLPHACS